MIKSAEARLGSWKISEATLSQIDNEMMIGSGQQILARVTSEFGWFCCLFPEKGARDWPRLRVLFANRCDDGVEIVVRGEEIPGGFA